MATRLLLSVLSILRQLAHLAMRLDPAIHRHPAYLPAAPVVGLLLLTVNLGIWLVERTIPARR